MTSDSGTAPTAPTVSLAAARSQWVRAAGLAGPRGGDVAELVDATGWLRTLGGVDPYLAVLARRPGLSLDDVTAAVADGRLRITPAVRNCIYAVPADRRAAALAEARSQSAGRADRDATTAGIASGELDEVGSTILDTLTEALTTDQIRSSLPGGTVRSLGDDGARVGMSSTLPPALRRLEFADRIHRHPVDDRIDTERHRWAVNPNPSPDDRRDEERRVELVRHHAAASGPVTLEETAGWMGVGRRETAAALDAAGLEQVHIEEHGHGWVVPEQLDELFAAEPVDPHNVRLLGFEDVALVTHTPAAWFATRHHGLRLPVWGKGSHTLGGAHHLAMRTVLVGDHMAGFWAWDPDTRSVELGLLEAADSETRAHLDDAAEATTEFLREGFGHARMTSIDSDSTERSRLEALRHMLD